ncbi:hypothetical protein [Streptomyces bluensis]|nr:hypothetical protein [Streptomyces bluensis]GGZ77725.1 hypothetical protein GCM10010344_51040 [Streptomyces bluensis]
MGNGTYSGGQYDHSRSLTKDEQELTGDELQQLAEAGLSVTADEADAN